MSHFHSLTRDLLNLGILYTPTRRIEYSLGGGFGLGRRETPVVGPSGPPRRRGRGWGSRTTTGHRGLGEWSGQAPDPGRGPGTTVEGHRVRRTGRGAHLQLEAPEENVPRLPVSGPKPMPPSRRLIFSRVFPKFPQLRVPCERF